MNKSGSSWLKFGLFTVGLGQSFVFVIVPPLARELGLSEVQTSSIFAFSAIGWALTSAAWGRASDKYGRRNIAILGLLGYSASLIAMITPLFLVEKDLLDLIFLFAHSKTYYIKVLIKSKKHLTTSSNGISQRG